MGCVCVLREREREREGERETKQDLVKRERSCKEKI
jgi:hypothetical protein